MKKLLVFSIAASFLLLTGCNSPVDEPAEVTAVPVKVLDLSVRPQYQIEEVGTIKPLQEVELVAKASGTIGKISHKIGDFVDGGELIAVIDYDEANNPAQVNYDSAKLQLANAQQSLDETLANNADAVTRAQLRVQTLENTLARLKRNLTELLSANVSTEKTLTLQLESAKKNAETAQINYNKIVSQFEQSWIDLLNSTKTSLDGVFINLESNFLTIESVLNPTRTIHFNSSTLNRNIGATDSIQRNDMINDYNDFVVQREVYEDAYSGYLPLNDSGVSEAIVNARDATDVFRVLLGEIRITLSNSITNKDLTSTTLETYKQTVAKLESTTLGDITIVNGLEKAIQAFKIDRTSQIATSDNNVVIANNQLADAQNALTKFKTSSRGTVQDLEAQIDQTSNDILSAQADLASARRTATLQNNAKILEISTLQNQLKLAEHSLENNRVESSIGGYLSELNVDEGDYVSQGTVLGRVIQHRQVKVVFYVTEENAQRLSVGEPFVFTSNETSDAQFTGAITKISPSADAANKKIRVEGMAENAGLLLKPEMFVSIALDLSATTFKPGTIYIPMNTIIFAQNDRYVYVVDGDVAVRRDVQIGDVYNSWVEVTQGLSKTELLITEGQRNLLPDGETQVTVIK